MKSLRFVLSVVLVSLSTVGFRAVRRAEARWNSCSVRGAEVLHNHEKPGGRVGRPRHCSGDAGRCLTASRFTPRCA